jgi:hypothetical protein
MEFVIANTSVGEAANVMKEAISDLGMVAEIRFGRTHRGLNDARLPIRMQPAVIWFWLRRDQDFILSMINLVATNSCYIQLVQNPSRAKVGVENRFRTFLKIVF